MLLFPVCTHWFIEPVAAGVQWTFITVTAPKISSLSSPSCPLGKDHRKWGLDIGEWDEMRWVCLQTVGHSVHASMAQSCGFLRLSASWCDCGTFRPLWQLNREPYITPLHVWTHFWHCFCKWLRLDRLAVVVGVTGVTRCTWLHYLATAALPPLLFSFFIEIKTI